MKTLLNYDQEHDQEVYSSGNMFLKVGNKNNKIKILAATVAGSRDKPNEDAYFISTDKNILFIAVLDGTTSLKQPPFLKGMSGARFASHLLKKILEHVDPKLTPEEILMDLNQKLLLENINLGGDLNDTNSLCASMATLIKVDLKSNFLEIAHVGDTYGIAFYENGKSGILTDDKNKKFDDKMFRLLEKLSSEKGISNKEARQTDEVGRALINMYILRNNNPNGKGSGLINGDPNVNLYINSKKLPLKNIKALLIATDGFEIQGKSITNSNFRKSLLNTIKTKGLKELVKLKKQSEDDDPDWKYVRYKHSDDATCIFVELN